MITTTSLTNRQRVQNALATFVDSDRNDNSYQYFRTSDLQEIDSQVCGHPCSDNFLLTIQNHSYEEDCW